MQDFAGFSTALAVLASAAGCGLLMGIERERRKGAGPDRALAGVRSFTLAAIGGFANIPSLVGASGAVMLIGNLTRDVELKYTPRGTAVAQVSLAINRSWKNDAGETQVSLWVTKATARELAKVSKPANNDAADLLASFGAAPF